MRRKTSAALLAAAVLAASSAGAVEPQARDALRRAIDSPVVTFDGNMTVTYWHPRATTAEEVHVSYNPPNRYRWQFLLPDGRIDREMFSDGESEQLQIISDRQSFSGDAPKTAEKRMSPEQEWNLLLANYDVTLDGDDTVAGYPCQVIVLTPRTDGKPTQKIWVEKKSGVILEIRRMQPRSGSAMVSRFEKFTAWDPRDDKAPVVKMAAARAPQAHPLQVDFLSREDLKSDGRFAAPVPPGLRDGFVFESADFMHVKGGTVHQVRYTDGLCVLSLFQTERPTKSRAKSKEGAHDRTGMLEFVTWNENGRHYTLIGDVSRDLLHDISQSFRKP